MTAAGVALASVVYLVLPSSDPARQRPKVTVALSQSDSGDGGAAVPTEPAGGEGESAWKVAWEKGKKQTYRLLWNARSRLPLAKGQAMLSAATADADLAIRSFGLVDGRFRLVVALEKVRKYEVIVNEKSSAPAGKERAAVAAVEGQEALLEVTRLGGLRRVFFRPTATAEVRHLLYGVAAVLRVTPGADRRTEWEVNEKTSIGDARVRYSVVAGGAGRKLSRQVVSFKEIPGVSSSRGGMEAFDEVIKGLSTVALDEGGALVSIEDPLDVEVSAKDDPTFRFIAKSSFSLVRIRVEDFVAGELPSGFSEEHKARMDPSKETQQKLEEQLAGDMSDAELRSTIRANADGMPLPQGFVVKAAAYLRLKQAKSKPVAEMFAENDLSPTGRGLVLDVLTAAGDAPAQAGFREALSTPAARSDKEMFGHFLMRFMFLRRPDRASVHYLVGVHDEAKRQNDETVRHASVVALGSVVGKLYGMGEEALAREIHRQIRKDLEDEKATSAAGQEGFPAMPSSQRQVYLLRALGNAARPEDAELIAKFATDDVVEVRDQAAFSLRNIDTPKARVTLFALAQDESTTVATTALRAMRTHSMTKENWTEIRALVGDKKIPKTADASLVELIRAQRRVAGADGDAILRDVIVRAGGGDPTLRDSAQQLLNLGK